MDSCEGLGKNIVLSSVSILLVQITGQCGERIVQQTPKLTFRLNIQSIRKFQEVDLSGCLLDALLLSSNAIMPVALQLQRGCSLRLVLSEASSNLPMSIRRE
jgi:hypothetical protein